MKIVGRFFRIVHGFIATLFAVAAVMLIGIAVSVGGEAIFGGITQEAALKIIEVIGLLAAAVVALQISETIFEEEVVRNADISAPTRIRRFLSRFFVVVIVALAIEGLVATFKANHKDMTQLTYASFLIVAVGVLLSAWGIFIRLNRFAEELEPMAMADAKREDDKLKE